MSSRSETSHAWYNGIQKLKHGIISEINCAFLAKVIKYDTDKHIADIKPLARTSDGQDSAQYLDIPVADSCYLMDELLDKLQGKGVISGSDEHFMRKGAIVVCIVLDRDSDNWEGENDTFMPNSSRMHNANDAIVISVLGDDI